MGIHECNVLPGWKQLDWGSVQKENNVSPLLSNLKHRLSLYRDENGATVLEWAVLASSIIAVAVLTITDLGQTVAGLYQRAANIIGAYL